MEKGFQSERPDQRKLREKSEFRAGGEQREETSEKTGRWERIEESWEEK